jgi:hypothetical protein
MVRAEFDILLFQGVVHESSGISCPNFLVETNSTAGFDERTS